jgi:cullin 3
MLTISRARKTLPHAHLISEVIGQLNSRFKPDLSMMKRRIESLIEREYLERVEGSEISTYAYLA